MQLLFTDQNKTYSFFQSPSLNVFFVYSVTVIMHLHFLGYHTTALVHV